MLSISLSNSEKIENSSYCKQGCQCVCGGGGGGGACPALKFML